jgi:DNA-binding transcriptional ArsR family regulator
MDEQGDVFKALADPTRRAILDALFAVDGQTLAQLCEPFADLSRFAVMKHLAVLERANLVVAVRSGREKHHYLNPVPIEQVANRWIGKYAGRFTSALFELDEHVRRTNGTA